MSVYTPNSEWSFLGVSEGKIYAHDFKTGLKIFEDNAWVPLPNQQKLPPSVIPTAILPLKNGTSLLSTLKHGLYTIDKDGITKLQKNTNALFENERIYSATAIDGKSIALATTNGGVYIINLSGEIIQGFSKREGLQTNNILYQRSE